MIASLTDQLVAALLVSLRIAPTFAFAPPFTLLRVPAIVRLFLSLSLAWLLISSRAPEAPAPTGDIAAAAAGELLLGVTIALSLQLAFAALQTAGRAIDIQVGFGLAQIADPTLRSQMPLVGALFSYAAAAVFFSTGGPTDLLAIWAHSLDAVPIGAFAAPTGLEMLLEYVRAVFLLAMGIAGVVFMALFLLDMAIGLMSRTLPQMNVLVLGFQVKTLALLVTLPLVFALSGSLFLRLVRLALDAALRLP